MLFSVGAAAAVFLALFFGLQWHIALCTVLAVGVYFGLFLLLKPTRRLKWSGTPFAPEEEKVEQLFEEAADDLQDGKSVRCFESAQPVAHFLTRGWKQTSKTIPW